MISGVFWKKRRKRVFHKLRDWPESVPQSFLPIRNDQSMYGHFIWPVLFAYALAAEPPRFIKIGGVMRMNLEHQTHRRRVKAHPLHSHQRAPNANAALATISSTHELKDYTSALEAPVSLAAPVQRALKMIKEPQYAEQVNLKPAALLREIGDTFSKYRIPIGMLPKLLTLGTDKPSFKLIFVERSDAIEFIIDDSFSMRTQTSSVVNGDRLTRWQKAHETLKAFVELFALIPFKIMRICFRNRCDVIKPTRLTNQTPRDFIKATQDDIDKIFEEPPLYQSSLTEKLEESLKQTGRIIRYLFCNGEKGVADVSEKMLKLLEDRRAPADNPVTLFSFTEQVQDADWMRKIARSAPSVSQFDAYSEEIHKVLKEQGNAFPFSYGFYLAGSLLAATEPKKFTMLHDALPLSKQMFDETFGITYTDKDFDYYLNEFIKAQKERKGISPADKVKREMDWEKYRTQLNRVSDCLEIPEVKQYTNRLADSHMLLSRMDQYKDIFNPGFSSAPKSPASPGNLLGVSQPNQFSSASGLSPMDVPK